ncbi:hypothetical protein [Solitalea lacus]|uniref:hypothetical protein n=1 Tax=Solitalea lacus TaxID=2911172 RepID=UPI001EDBC644|nr:hypothetical protein [Solitalea lacus]UKJ07141.1 hypothetical protein L2B55_16625 [Solitalea lacus]
MKKIYHTLLLLIGLTVAVACKKDETVKLIDTTKLTTYLWKGEELPVVNSSYFIKYDVSYDFSVDASGRQICRKSVTQGLTKYDYYGTWILEDNKVKITESSSIPDNKIFSEVINIIELNDHQFVFKREASQSNSNTNEKVYKATSK